MMKKILIKFTLCILILFMVGSNAWGLVFTNESDGAITMPPFGNPKAIRHLIIHGAGNFLKSYSLMLSFLASVEVAELEGADCGLLLSSLDGAAAHMNKTRQCYLAITKEADCAHYDHNIIAKLANFNYKTFQRDRGLNRGAFNRVRHYLEKGDVRGMFHKLLEDVEDISSRLGSLRVQLAAGRIPEIEAAWRTNQAFAETLLFGQYVAEVFMNVRSK